jgi:hypothetical protein
MDGPIWGLEEQTEHHRDLLQAVEMDKLARIATAGRSTGRVRLLLRAGDALISLGHRLRGQCRAAGHRPGLPVPQVGQHT